MKKSFKVSLGLFFGGVAMMIISIETGFGGDTIFPVFVLAALAGIVVFVISVLQMFADYVSWHMSTGERGAERSRRLAERAAVKAEKVAEKERLRREKLEAERAAEQRRREIEYAHRPVAAVIVDSSSVTKTKGNAGKVLVGGALFGLPGAMMGAAGKRKSVTETKTVTFAVKYADGSTGIETVKVGSERYNTLVRLLVEG